VSLASGYGSVLRGDDLANVADKIEVGGLEGGQFKEGKDGIGHGVVGVGNTYARGDGYALQHRGMADLRDRAVGEHNGLQKERAALKKAANEYQDGRQERQ